MSLKLTKIDDFLSKDILKKILFIVSNMGEIKENEEEWKINRGVFFSRKENYSWHSYKGDNISERFSLVYNLNTNNVKKVCEIENLNYFKVKFLRRINPYLVKYLKFKIN